MMNRLTDTQALILRTASHHPDRLAAPPVSLPPSPRGAVAKSLLSAGLVEVLRDEEGQDAGLVWKLDGEAVVLRITDAGLAAIGITVAASQGEPEGSETATSAARRTELPHDAPAAPQQGDEGAGAPSGATVAPMASTGRTSPARALRAAAQQVLAAWDNDARDRAGLAEAIAAVRTALPPALPSRQPREPGARRPPRTGTKQEAVLALLRRPEGASGPDMIEATGWAPHTVRGFLAGLKKRGFEVVVHERVRQVGPGKEGAKGSYTVYRIAAEPAA